MVGQRTLPCVKDFNSRPSARGDLPGKVRHSPRRRISIHAPPRGATASCGGALRMAQDFNSRPSARGDTKGKKTTRKTAGFQFTPLREGRPAFARRRKTPYIISIHAPPRGATRLSAHSAILAFHFNSRPSARGDALRKSQCERFQPISIHAPPRGATTLLVCNRITVEISIHAPPRGATRGFAKLIAAGQFQFTPLREGRPHRSSQQTQQTDISIHAPPRGATMNGGENTVMLTLFQFTPLREGRRFDCVRRRGKS